MSQPNRFTHTGPTRLWAETSATPIAPTNHRLYRTIRHSVCLPLESDHSTALQETQYV